MWLGGLFVIAFSSGSQGQITCTTELDQFDEFTKQRTLSVGPSIGSNGPTYSWRAVNDRWCLRITWEFIDDSPGVALEGDTLWLMLENDQVIALPCATTTTAVHHQGSSGKSAKMGIYDYRVSPEQARLLDQYWIKRLRIHFQDGDRDYDAEKDPLWQLGMAKTVSCFMESCNAKRVSVPTGSNTAEHSPALQKQKL